MAKMAAAGNHFFVPEIIASTRNFYVQRAARCASGRRAPTNLKYNQGLDLLGVVPRGYSDAILISNRFCKSIAAQSFRFVLAGIKALRPAPSDSVCPIEKVCYITQEPAGHPRSRWSNQKTGRGGDRGSRGFPLHCPRKTNGFPTLVAGILFSNGGGHYGLATWKS